jgi:Glycosyltransferase family 87
VNSPPHVDTSTSHALDSVMVLRRVGTTFALGLLPVVALITMLVVGLSDHSLSADFHHEIYPQAKEMLHGANPYPPAGFDPTIAANYIWPPLVAFVLGPLTVLPVGVADVVMLLLGLACMGASLWLVGLRDWRVYGLVALWPEVVGEMRVSHLTAQICLLLALAWRTRNRPAAAGLAVGLATALKFFVWPLAIWLAATRRSRATVIAMGVVAGSLLLVLPYTSVDGYARSLVRLGHAFDQDSYTVFGLLVQSGAAEGVARAATWAVGLGLLVATVRYRSFTLAVVAALTLSPIVWLDYFAIAIVPLAIARPRLSWVWFLPLATWGLRGAGLGIGDPWDIGRLLLVFAVVFAVAFRDEPERVRAPAPITA